ncbi:MAG: shikimate dehydrogenase, partial [Candidatus Adiutrix sp.]
MMIQLGIIGDEHVWKATLTELFSAALKSASLNGTCHPFEVLPENMPNAILGLAALGFRGLAVTGPYGQGIIPHLAGTSQMARLIGSVNTIVCADGGFWGY